VLGRRTEILVISVLMCGIIGYASLGLVFAGTRIAAAEHTVDAVVSHQNTLNATFRSINIQLTALGTRSSFDGPQAIELVESSVANAELASRTVSQDEASLSAADHALHEHPWLTAVSNSAVARATDRIRHARQALEIASSLAADQVQDGRFWQALYSGLADLGELNRERDAGNLGGARDALTRTGAEIDRAAALAPSPGLPPELGALAAALRKLVADYGRQLDAEAADSYDAAAAISVDVSADMAQIAHFDVDGIGAQIDAYFRPRIDSYNREIAAATS
jgi:hypothetical protein